MPMDVLENIANSMDVKKKRSKRSIRRLDESGGKNFQTIQGTARGSTVWINNQMDEQIKAYQETVFLGVLKLIPSNFCTFPTMTLFLQDIPSDLHVPHLNQTHISSIYLQILSKFSIIVPRIDWTNNDSSDDIRKRYDAEVDEYIKVFNPKFTVFFRPVIEEKDFLNRWTRECVIGNYDGIVNVEYRAPQVTYAKVWKHVPNRPISLEFFDEDDK